MRPSVGLAPLVVAACGHLAPAKINLALHVTGRRPDGYHTLSSLVAFAGVGDHLAILPASVDSFETTGPFAVQLAGSLPPGERNIALAALDSVRGVIRLHGRDLGPLAIVLDKRLPVASGIGGGSADAAALIRLAVAACPDIEAPLLDAAIPLGADVPMCVGGRAARIAGIGETVEPIADFPDVAAVLVNPGVPVATPSVFRALTNRENPAMPETPAFDDVARLVDFLRKTRNDLEEPAVSLAPAIADARRVLESAGALFARMSGSGATVFGLFADGDQARAAAKAILEAHPRWWVAPTILGSMKERTA